ASDRTEETSGADEHGCMNLAARNPAIGPFVPAIAIAVAVAAARAATFELLEATSLRDARAAGGKQEVIELAPADPVTHRPRVAYQMHLVAHAADAKSRDRIDRAIPAVRGHVEPELAYDSRRDPARADLVARKRRLVGDDHVRGWAHE